MATRSASSPVSANPSNIRVVTADLDFDRRPFLEHIGIDHGPVHLLSQFFLLADATAKASGVTLVFASMHDLVAANRSNSESWRPLLPHYDPSYGGITRDNAFCVLGINDSGEVVATQAARLYTLADTSVLEEASSLRLFYPDPPTQARPGEGCVITAPSAGAIQGRIAFSGAAWYRPDYRGRDLVAALSRVSRAYAHATWNTEHTVTFVAKPLVEKGFVQRCGYACVEWAVELRGFEIGPYYGAFVHIGTAQMFEDLFTFMVPPQPQIDARILKRRA
jgi:hypothetical protein